MATLEEAFREKGATESMINSKTFKMAEEVIAEETVEGISEAAAIARQADTAATNAQRTLVQLKRANDEAFSILRAVNTANDALAEEAARVTVTDKNTLAAINAYTMVLVRTKEVVGPEGLTEGVWQQAIEAASYCAWRASSGSHGSSQPFQRIH